MTALVGEARNRLERDAIGSALTLFSNHHALNIIIVWNILIGSSFCRDEDGHLFYDVLVVIVAAARGEGESSKHHKCDSPEFQCFHFAKNFIFLNYFVWQSYRKSHEKAPGKAWKSGAEGVSLKLLSEFKCLLFDFTVESDVFKISVVYFSFFAAPKYDYSEIICIFAPENKKITIMTQILVTLNEDATTVHVRKAIEMLRGVVSTTVFKTKDESNKKTLRQQAYVKESLKRAFDEMKQARREGRKLQSADDFIKELEAEESV